MLSPAADTTHHGLHTGTLLHRRRAGAGQQRRFRAALVDEKVRKFLQGGSRQRIDELHRGNGLQI
ncbi:MAG TPA: hypothetical protein VGO11_12190 [Chthoniobacteraceae bacterium]|jgi:hypothetical protein|nr:hypothetical protein [Chthoniobacteraceae bacterium]